MTDLDDDDISVTSTVPSEPALEYTVNAILDERSSENGIEYLVRWEDYPIERSTWEPKDNFNDPQTLHDWKKKKRLIDAGKRLPFDLARFEQHKAKVESDSLERKRKRAAKRRRLGIQRPDTLQLETSTGASPQSEPERGPAAPQRLPALAIASRPSAPLTGRVRLVADKPPMVGFGKPETSPVVGPRRPGNLPGNEPTERFKLLSTQHRHNKAKSKEPVPNIDQLELRRPSEWPSRNPSAANLGQHSISSPNAVEPTRAPRESNDLQVTRPSAVGVGAAAVEQHSSISSEVVDAMPSQALWSPILRQETSEDSTGGSGLAIHGLASRIWGTNDHAAGANFYNQGRDAGTNEAIQMPSRRPKLGNSRRVGNRFWNRGEVLIHLFYGPAKNEIGSVRLCGLPTYAKNMILDIKKTRRFDLWFQHVCTLGEYRILCDEVSDNEIGCNGWIEGFDDTEPFLYEIGEELKGKKLIAICCIEELHMSLLAYSPDSSISKSFGDSGCDNTTFVAIAARSALPVMRKLDRPSTRPTLPSSGPVAASPPPPPPPLDLDATFKERFGITFRDLATVQGPEGPRLVHIFYLMFPLDDGIIQQECEVIMAFLKSGGRDPVIYSNRQQDDWKKFIRSSSDGVVLFHQTFVDYHTLLDLTKGVCRSSFNFWTVSLDVPLQFAKCSLNFQRLFPHGGVILLTEDFMIRDPEGASITLAWFNDYIKRKFPGLWRLMLPPDALNWLLKRHEREIDKEKAGHWLGMYRSVMEANKSSPTFAVESHDMNCVNLDFNSPPVISPTHLSGYGSRKEDDHPDIPKGLTQAQRDTDHLVEFFAGWALTTCHMFRHFIVVTTSDQPRWRSWHHVEIHRPKEFMKSFKIAYSEYWAKLKPQSNLPSSSTSVSGPAQFLQQSPNHTPSTPNAELEMPWRGPSQVRARDSGPPRPSPRCSPRNSPRDSPRGSPYPPRDSRPPRYQRRQNSYYPQRVYLQGDSYYPPPYR